MKKILLSIALMITTLTAFAQDVIVKMDNSLVVAKIIEVTDTHVKYKDFNQPDGPSFELLLSNVARIKLANGVEMNFGAAVQTMQGTKKEELSQNNDNLLSDERAELIAKGLKCINSDQFFRLFNDEQLRTILSAEDYSLYNKARSQHKSAKITEYVSCGITGVGLITALSGLFFMDTPVGAATAFAGIGAVCVGVVGELCVSLPLEGSSSKNFNKAFTDFKKNTSPQMALNFGLQKNGVGVSLSF